MHQIEKNAGVGVTTVGKLMHANKIDSDPVNTLIHIFI